MGCVKAANQLILKDEEKRWKIGVFLQKWEGNVRKIIERQWMAKHDAPQLGALESFADASKCSSCGWSEKWTKRHAERPKLSWHIHVQR